eukprot:c14067_g1_i1.p1 GENE.c14067_g1_i1~~c14067_g1_i1.p1  ORF type:complete len:276 (-),score=111.68 c14067_g1_i1:23-850(-)
MSFPIPPKNLLDLIWNLGPFQPKEINVISYDNDIKKYSDDIENGANMNWEKLQSEKKGLLFDGIVWTLKNVEIKESSKLELILQPSSYRYVMYTHYSSFGIENLSKEQRANPIGISALCITTDNKIVLGKRSPHVAVCKNMWHVIPAGNLDNPNLSFVLKTEMREELGLEWENVVQRETCLGLFDTGVEQGNKPEIVWFVQLNISSEEVESSMKKNPHKEENGLDEHDNLVFINRNDIKNFISQFDVVGVCKSILNLVDFWWDNLLKIEEEENKK